jgi:hypothetical protein
MDISLSSQRSTVELTGATPQAQRPVEPVLDRFHSG